MYIPESISDITFLSEVNFLHAKRNMFSGNVPDTLTYDEECAAIMMAVIDSGIWDVDTLSELPFSLNDDIGLLNDSFKIVEVDKISILRLYTHIKNIISQYAVDESKFTDDYQFTHKGIAYRIYRKAVKNAITGEWMHDVSYDCGQSAMEVQRVWASEVAKDYTGTEYYNFHMRQIACLARSLDCKTLISPFERAEEMAKKIVIFQDVKSDVIKDLVFFFNTICGDLVKIPNTSSFLRAYPNLEELVIQANTITLLKNKAIEYFNKREWI